MAGRKKKELPDNCCHSSVKCALGTIILPPFRQAIIAIISQLSIQATSIAYLGSLLFLYKVCINFFLLIRFIKCITFKMNEWMNGYCWCVFSTIGQFCIRQQWQSIFSWWWNRYNQWLFSGCTYTECTWIFLDAPIVQAMGRADLCGLCMADQHSTCECIQLFTRAVRWQRENQHPHALHETSKSIFSLPNLRIEYNSQQSTKSDTIRQRRHQKRH